MQAAIKRGVIAEWLEDRRLLSTVVFSGKQDFDVGAFPDTLTSAFLNADNNADLVAGNDNDATVSVLLGNGDGTFGAQTAYAVGDFPHGVSTALLNNDSIPDIITANAGATDVGSVSVLIGKGDGTFLPQKTFTAGSDPSHVVAADFNHDGKQDLVVSNAGSNNVSVLLGKGDGTFATQTKFAVGADPNWVATGDINGDGKIDIVTANRDDDTISVLLGKGNGSFASQEVFDVGSDPWSVVVGDFNLDGSQDIATANYQGDSVSVLMNGGKGALKSAKDYNAGFNPSSITADDMNDDGFPDLIVADNSGKSVSVLVGQGNGTFHSPRTFAVGDTPYVAVTADFNNDSNPDIASIDYRDFAVRVLLDQPVLRAPKLTTPQNGAVKVSLQPTFNWTSVSQATQYRIIVGTDSKSMPTDPSFTGGVSGAALDMTDITSMPFTIFTHLRPGTKYFWEVQAQSGDQLGDWSSIASFTTVPDTAPVIKKIADAEVAVGVAFSSSGSFTDPDRFDSWTGTIDWGDGTGRHTLTLNSNKKFVLNHTFSKLGTYLATVVVKDHFGNSFTRQFHVNVVKLQV